LSTSEGLIRSVGVAAWLTLAWGIAGAVLGGRGSKIGPLQLSGDPEQVRTVVQGADAGGLRKMKRQLAVDYAFLFFYWLTFVGLAIVIARRGGATYKSVAFISILAATLTALLDVLENIRTRGVLALSRPGDQVRLQLVEHLRRTSLLKWFASAATVALLSVAFLPGESRLVGLGIAFLVVAGIGFAGVRWNRLIFPYLGLFFLLGAVITAWFTFWPEDVVAHL
jgi:hypothetical protein